MGAICCKQRKDGQPTSSPTVVFTDVTEDVELTKGCVNQGFNTKHDVQEGSGDKEGRYAREPTASSSQTPSRDAQSTSSTDSQSIPSTDAPTPPSTAPPKPPRTDAPTSPKTSKADVKGRGSRIVSALYDYTSKTTEEDLLFQKDDRMIVLDDSDLDGWLMAEHVKTHEKGYIPSNFVAEDNVQESMDTNTDACDDPDIKQRKPLPKVPTTPSTDKRTTSSPDKQTTPNKDALPDDSSVQVQAKQRVVTALYDWVSKHEGDLTFKKGDVMILLDETDSDWCLAEHIETHEKGYIPRKYFGVEDSLESMDWFHGKQARKDCEKQLTMPDNIPGTFCIRINEAHADQTYVLSILEDTTERTVKHYKILPPDDKGEIYATKRSKHATLHSLVEHHRKRADGLCCQLTQSCPKLKPTLGDLSKSTKDKWKIPRSELVIKEMIGKGNFGEVYEGELHGGQTMVAIKKLKSGSMDTEAFLAEANIMKKYNHEKLVHLYAVCAEEEPIYIVTELMCNGDLLTHLRSDVGQELDFQTLIYMIAQIASGMAYLESKKFVHRDLAARNILVGENNHVKVADFGLAKIIDDEEYTVECIGDKFPVKWTAPEAAKLHKFSIKSDVWSFGILVFEIVTRGGKPYPGMSNKETLEELERGYRIPQPIRDLPEEHKAIWDLQMKCWKTVPKERPTFEWLFNFYDDYTVASERMYKNE